MSTPARIAPYDAFAWFYDRYWNRRFHSRAWPIVKRVLLERLPPGAAILDVGCGTGYLAARLSGRGFQVTGIDVSARMLDAARGRVPEAEFHLADARAFRLDRRFQAAVCTFDTLNHLVTPEDLAGAFASVERALEPGGLFFFDVLLEEAFREQWQDDFHIVEPDHVLLIAGQGFDPRDRMAHCRITMFRQVGGAWKRSDTVISERCHSRDEIGAALDAAGFLTAACYDARDLGMEGEIGAGRVFFLASRIRRRATAPSRSRLGKTSGSGPRLT